MLIRGEPTRRRAPPVSVTSGAIVLVESKVHELVNEWAISGINEAVETLEPGSSGVLGSFASEASFTASLACWQVSSKAAPKANTRNVLCHWCTPVTVVTIVIKEIEVLELTLGRILVVVDKAIQAIVVLI